MGSETVEKIAVSSLVEDFSLYPRASVDDYHVSEIAGAIEAGVELPPLVVERGTMRIVDGFHRRRAYVRALGPDVVAPCLVRTYRTEALLYEEAMRLNAGHGRALSAMDKAHAIKIGLTLQIDPDVIAKDLGITTERVQQIVTRKITSIEGTRRKAFLKRSVHHMAGQELTKEQEAVLGRLGGDQQRKMIGDLIAMANVDLLDLRDPGLVSDLRELVRLLVPILAAIRQTA